MDPIAISEEDAAELSRILNEESISSDGNDASVSSDKGEEIANVNRSDSDDEAIIWENTHFAFPMPAKCTEDIIPKREDDRISGNMPFAEKKNGDRIYKVGKNRIIIRKVVVSKLLSFLTFPFIRHTKYDRKLVETLLILTVGVTDVTMQTKIDDDIKNFVRALVAVRVRDDQDRLNQLESYFQQFLEKYSK